MQKLLLLLLLLLSFLLRVHSQNIDSIGRAVDSSSIVLQQVTQQFDTLQNRQRLEQFLEGMREREKAEKRQTYIRFGLAIVFLIVLVYGMQRKRRIQRGLKA